MANEYLDFAKIARNNTESWIAWKFSDLFVV